MEATHATEQYYKMWKRNLEQVNKDDPLGKNNKKVESVEYVEHKNYRQTSFLREDSTNAGFCLKYIVFTSQKTEIGLPKECSYIIIGMRKGLSIGRFQL